jgi:5-hydroxyisourate hydrolase-like protein (transthyretin family)
MLTLLTGCLVLVGLPTVALDNVDDYLTVPLSRYSDMLVDPAHERVFVTGGSGTDEVAVVRLDGSGTTTVPGTPGAAQMALSEDGRFVYVVLREGDGVAEIDTSTLVSRRLPTGAGSCPTDVAAYAGYVWYIGSFGSDKPGSCSQRRAVWRLDPVTGEVAEQAYVGYTEKITALYAVPQHMKLVYAEGGDLARATLFGVTDGVAALEATVGIDPYLNLAPGLTDDGEHLVAATNRDVRYFRTSDLSADGVTTPGTTGYFTATHADSDVLATASDPGQVHLVRRVGGEPVNSISFGPAQAGYVRGIAMVDDRMIAVTEGADLRLYQVDRPAVPAPNLAVQAPKESEVGTTVTVSGVLSDGGAPIPEAGVVLRQVGVDEPLGRDTTDDSGNYAIDFVPDELGTVALTAHYAGDAARKPAIGKGSTDVVRRTVSLSLSGPGSVWPDEDLVLTGELQDRGEPLAGGSITIHRSCSESYSWHEVETVTTGLDGTFTSRSAPPTSCSSGSYDYRARYVGDEMRKPTAKVVAVQVTWVYPFLYLEMRPWVYVGEPLDVAGRLTADGSPMVGEPVELHVDTVEGRRQLGTVRTDAEGRFTLEDVLPVAGDYRYQASYLGNSRTRGTYRTFPVQVLRRPSELEINGPDVGDVDQRLYLSGRLTSEGVGVSAVKVLVTRSDAHVGTVDLPAVTTAADGSFLVRDVPPRGGDVIYAVSYPGSASREPAHASFLVPVRKKAQRLTLTSDRAVYRFGATAQLFVGPGTAPARHVKVHAKEAGRTRTLVFAGTVPKGGLTVKHRMTRNTVFTAVTPQTPRFQAAEAHQLRRDTRARLTTSIPKPRAVVDGYRLYRPTSRPMISTKVQALRDSGCIYFQIQRKDSRWTTVTTTPCRPVNADSVATWRPRSWLENRTAYRVRPTFRTDAVNVASKGTWIYLKFQ